MNPTSGCANKYSANAGTTWTAPQAGTASLVSMRSTGRGQGITYELITLTADAGGGELVRRTGCERAAVGESAGV